MNKKMRELLAKIESKQALVKGYTDGENKDLEKAKELLDEIEKLQDEYQVEKRLFENEKKVAKLNEEDIEEIEKNTKGLSEQAEKIFGFEVVNNFDWIKNISTIDFLRDYGKYFNINYMLDKDIIRRRLETGITFTEFSYMLLQSLDFLKLHEEKGVTLQVAGSDQWGNITSGIELTRKKLGKELYGMVMPLVTDSNGVKFGKTEGNALWLDKNKTSSYELYQYLINLEDSMIIEYLKKLTFLSKEEIEELEKKHNCNPHLREAHKALAREVITDLHGKEEYEKAVKISEALFSGNVSSLSKDEILMCFKDVPSFNVKEGVKLIDMLVDNKICTSKREAREFLKASSISINDKKVTEEEMLITKDIAIEGELLVIKRGKKKNFIGKIS